MLTKTCVRDGANDDKLRELWASYLGAEDDSPEEDAPWGALCEHLGLMGRDIGGQEVIDEVYRRFGWNIIGRTSERFGTTRDGHGKLISINTADPGLLLNRRK